MLARWTPRQSDNSRTVRGTLGAFEAPSERATLVEGYPVTVSVRPPSLLDLGIGGTTYGVKEVAGLYEHSFEMENTQTLLIRPRWKPGEFATLHLPKEWCEWRTGYDPWLVARPRFVALGFYLHREHLTYEDRRYWEAATEYLIVRLAGTGFNWFEWRRSGGVYDETD